MPACLLPFLVQHIVILVKGAKSFFFPSSLVSREVLPDQYYIFLKIFSKRGRVKSILKIVANSRRPFGIKLTKKSVKKLQPQCSKRGGQRLFGNHKKKTALLVREGFPYIEMFLSVQCICQCICICIPMYL